MKFCVNCGYPLKAGQKFCTSCGKKLPENDNNSLQVKQAEENKEIVQDSQNTGETSTQNNEINNPENQVTDVNINDNVVQNVGQESVNQQEAVNPQIQNNPSVPNKDQIPSNSSVQSNGLSPNNTPVEYNGQLPNNLPVQNSAPVPNNPPVQNNGQVPNNVQAMPKKNKKPMSKGAKIAILIVSVLILLGAVGFGVGLSITSEKHVVKNIKEAIEKKDSKQLAKYLYFSEGDIEIEEADVASLIEYINKNQGFKNELFKKLDDGRKYSGFEVVDNGKTMLVFKKYVLKLEPQYLELESNFENVEVKLDGKSIGKINEMFKTKKFGPFFPREYKLEYLYEYEGETVQLEKNVQLFNGKYKDKGYFDIHFVTVESEVDNMKYFLDGTEKSKEIVIGTNKLGPFSFVEESTLVFSKDYSWGKINSKEYSTFDYSIYIEDFELKDSDFIKSAAPTIKEFVQSYYAAKSSQDSGKLVNATDNCKAVFNDEYFFTSYQYTFKGVSVDLEEGLEVFTDEGLKTDVFKVKVAAEFTKNDGDTGTDTGENTEGTVEDNSTKEAINLQLIYDEANKKWMVNAYDIYGWHSDDLLKLE